MTPTIIEKVLTDQNNKIINLLYSNLKYIQKKFRNIYKNDILISFYAKKNYISIEYMYYNLFY